MRARAQQLTGRPVKIVVIQEAGLDGFWVHRLLEANGIESHVVIRASIAVPRRRRRAKTNAIDGETLLRTLLAWTRGEPRVCAMVVPPTPEQEDRRWVCRESAILLQERIRHTNRIKGLLAGQGITDFNPLHKDRRQLLDAARTGDGRPLPHQLKAEIMREIELIELLLRQIADVEAAREVLAGPKAAKAPFPVVLLEQDDTDRLSLTNALADADIDRQKPNASRPRSFDAIHDNVATRAAPRAPNQNSLLPRHRIGNTNC
jgi:transposase